MFRSLPCTPALRRAGGVIPPPPACAVGRVAAGSATGSAPHRARSCAEPTTYATGHTGQNRDGQARPEFCLQICHELLALSDPCASDQWIWPSHFSDRIQHGLPDLIPLPEPLSQLS